MTAQIAEDLGRLFEVGFNIGILSHIQNHRIKHRFGNLYVNELQNLKFSKIQQRVVDKLVSQLERNVAETWCQFFIQKGFLSGLNLFQEYLKSLGSENLEILYYQCSFNGDNSIGTYTVEPLKWFTNLLSQFTEFNISEDADKYIRKYKKKGDFLNADTLIFLKYGRNYRVLCVDLSVFSILADQDIENIDYVEVIRCLLLREVNYIRSKSVFSRLSIDTNSVGFNVSPSLTNYFQAFMAKDKESVKLIQAAAYIYSFYEFLEETGIIPDKSRLILNAVGYSDRSFNTLSIKPENIHIFQTCHQIYQNSNKQEQINDVRHRVLTKIKRSTAESFTNGKRLINALSKIHADEITILEPHTEKISDFYNSVAPVSPELISNLGLSGNYNLRQAHSELITKYLLSQKTYIFLTGNPGIGKTTAIVNFLKNHLKEGFLFLYVSPRKQVNLDIIGKFKDKQTGKLLDDNIFAINSNTIVIKENSGKSSVEYTSNKHDDDFHQGGVDFLNRENVERKAKRNSRLKHITDNLIQDVEGKITGVLNNIAQALYTIINQEISNNIIATVSIQSLKKTTSGSTLEHLEKIFRDAYSKKEDKVLPEKMQKISSRIKHLFIMIDEITGDEAGTEFLNGIHKIIKKYKLTTAETGFNTKVIVADASIVDKNVICQHLQNTNPEPDKIYFRHASDSIQPLSVENIEFCKLPSVTINANSYPARSLTIQYQIFINSYKFNQQSKLNNKSDLERAVTGRIFGDIKTLLENPEVEQFIVYIQNKPKLGRLIDQIQSKLGAENFQKFRDYLEIHANISEWEKQEVQKHQENVKVIFMTASGSRGLSFPKATHILVEMPRFEIEANLMEIIQVIYRGRGNDDIDNKDKYLCFYIAETCVYYGDNPQLSIEESTLSLLNLLLILKVSIMTRIYGYGSIGRKKYILIPIGGKSIIAAGETFSAQIANLIKQLKKEHQIQKSQEVLRHVYTSLEKLLESADFQICQIKKSEISYLSLQKSLAKKLLDKSFDNLLNIGAIEFGYISGGLLLVPAKNLEESYQIKLLDIERYADGQLWQNMHIIAKNTDYPESLRDAIYYAMELVEKLKNTSKTQTFQQRNRDENQYYAIPLLAFIGNQVMVNYFANQPIEPQDRRFRDILDNYVRLLYPVNHVLPIGSDYKEFPFVVFRSYSLPGIRQQMFNDNYLLHSQDLNVLNLILSQDV